MLDSYQLLAKELAPDGIVCYFQQDGQMVVSSQRGPAWPDRGNSFWVTHHDDQWFLFAWTNIGYRIPQATDMAAVCRACMNHGTKAMYRVPPDIVRQFGLTELSEEEADAATQHVGSGDREEQQDL